MLLKIVNDKFVFALTISNLRIFFLDHISSTMWTTGGASLYHAKAVAYGPPTNKIPLY